MNGGSLSIVVANDHPLIRAGLRDVLALDRRWRLVGFAKTGAETLKAIQRFKPDVAIIDIRISDPNAVEIASLVRAEFPHTKLCFLSNDADLESAMPGAKQDKAGGGIVVINERLPERLCEWLNEIAVRSIGRSRDCTLLPSMSASSRVVRRLTQRQAQIVAMLQIGLSNREISDRLGLSEGTVKVHLHRIYQKTGVSNRTQLAAQSIGE